MIRKRYISLIMSMLTVSVLVPSIAPVLVLYASLASCRDTGDKKPAVLGGIAADFTTVSTPFGTYIAIFFLCSLLMDGLSRFLDFRKFPVMFSALAAAGFISCAISLLATQRAPDIAALSESSLKIAVTCAVMVAPYLWTKSRINATASALSA